MDYGLIGIGMMSGIAYAISGYFKAYGQTSEAFDPSKALPALLIGGFIGAVGGAMNLQTDVAFSFFGFWGIVSGVENVLKGAKGLQNPTPPATPATPAKK